MFPDFENGALSYLLSKKYGSSFSGIGFFREVARQVFIYYMDDTFLAQTFEVEND